MKYEDILETEDLVLRFLIYLWMLAFMVIMFMGLHFLL